MSAYEVVTQDITFPDDIYYSYTLTAPTGKKPICGGIHTTYGGPGAPGPNYSGAQLLQSYPNGSDWNFTVFAGNSNVTATLYLVCLPAYTITAD
jgi:hypothetical protein